MAKKRKRAKPRPQEEEEVQIGYKANTFKPVMGKRRKRHFEPGSRAVDKCPKGFHNGKVKITTTAQHPKDSPDKRTVSACLDPQEEWAIHPTRRSKSSWTVTHAKSGLAAGTYSKNVSACIAKKFADDTFAGSVDGKHAVDAMWAAFGGKAEYEKAARKIWDNLGYSGGPAAPWQLFEQECKQKGKARGKDLVKRKRSRKKPPKAMAKKLEKAIVALDECVARCKAIPKKYNGETKPKCAGSCTKAFFRQVRKILLQRKKR
jgi:hypothetical protein